MSNQQIVQAVTNALSPQRLKTYEDAVVGVGDVGPAAPTLYNWNAQVSGAFMITLHIFEVVIRNTVSDALTGLYGIRWPWSPTFERSLPSPSHDYNPPTDLQRVRTRQGTTGKIIPELKFISWQKMFTSRFDVRIWDVHLRTAMPGLDQTKTVARLCNEIYSDLEHVRRLRNRIAHHEPIFRRSLKDDLEKITDLIRFRSQVTADWMVQCQRVTDYIRSSHAA